MPPRSSRRSRNRPRSILRISPAHLPVYGRDGQRVALMQVLREQPWETSHTIDVHVQASASPDAVRGSYPRVSSVRGSKPMWPDSASAPRVGRKGARLRTRRCFGPAGVLVFTTVAPSLLGAKTISALYRVRWQIGDRHKTLEKVCWMWATYAHEKGVRWPRSGCSGSCCMPWWWSGGHDGSLAQHWSRLDEERRGTFWRVWKRIQDEVGVHVLGVEAWREEGWEACMKVIMERPRRRKLQRLPDEVIDMYHGLPTSDQEELGEAA